MREENDVVIIAEKVAIKLKVDGTVKDLLSENKIIRSEKINHF